MEKHDKDLRHQMFRLAHISDLHLLSLEGVRWTQFLNKRWIGGLNLLSNRSRHYDANVFAQAVEDMNTQQIDHLFCTGDITNLAFESEFSFAQSLFNKLALGPDEVTILPGNHDAYVQEGHGYFHDFFAANLTSDAPWPDGDVFPVVRRRGNVTLIGLSTCLATPWFRAWGEIGEKQLGRLRQVLEGENGQYCVVGIHHPPVGKPAENRIRGLRDHKRLQELTREFQVPLLIHGHEHRDIRENIGDTLVRGVQSGTYVGGKPGREARYRIYEIDSQAGTITETERIFSKEETRFMDKNAA